MKKLLLLLWLQIRRHWSCGQGPQCSAHGCQGCGPSGVGFKSMLGEGREKENHLAYPCPQHSDWLAAIIIRSWQATSEKGQQRDEPALCIITQKGDAIDQSPQTSS